VGDEVRAVGDPDPAGDFCLWLEGGIYYICGFGEEGRFPKLLGFADLQKLVRSPGKPVPWAELDPRIGAIGSRSTQPAMDVPAIKAVRAKLDRLLEEMDSAENEVDQAESRREYEELSAYLRAELAPGGLTRDLNSPIGRSRSMIFDRRNTVLKKLRSTKPPLTKLADHFEHHISSRFEGFVYRPQGTPPQWRTEKTQK
jgi:hypothetical protein